jgi:hypothetical protein
LSECYEKFWLAKVVAFVLERKLSPRVNGALEWAAEGPHEDVTAQYLAVGVCDASLSHFISLLNLSQLRVIVV